MGFSPLLSHTPLSNNSNDQDIDVQTNPFHRASTSFGYKFVVNTGTSASSLVLTTGIYTVVLAPVIGFTASIAEHHAQFFGVSEAKARLGTQAALNLISSYSLSSQGLWFAKTLFSTLVTHSLQEHFSQPKPMDDECENASNNLLLNSSLFPFIGHIFGSRV